MIPRTKPKGVYAGSKVADAGVRINGSDLFEQVSRLRLVLDQPPDHLEQQRLEPFDLGGGDRRPYPLRRGVLLSELAHRAR
jgi:hypothetical protein